LSFLRRNEFRFGCKMPLSPFRSGLFQSDGKIVQIRPMQPYDETPVPSLSDTLAYALLVNQGWFERHGISAGTVIQDLPR
jgi:uncharacterized protein